MEAHDGGKRCARPAELKGSLPAEAEADRGDPALVDARLAPEHLERGVASEAQLRPVLRHFMRDRVGVLEAIDGFPEQVRRERDVSAFRKHVGASPRLRPEAAAAVNHQHAWSGRGMSSLREVARVSAPLDFVGQVHRSSSCLPAAWRGRRTVGKRGPPK